MFSFSYSALASVTALSLVLCVLWTRQVLGLRVALLLSVARLAVPVTYFIWFFNGTWTQIDDIGYWHAGRTMLELGFNPATALSTHAGILQLEAIDGGFHILYQWWNCLVFFFFGTYYFAPVILNVAWSFIAAYYLYRLVLICGFSRPYARAVAVWMLLYPEVIAWTSFMDMKDTIVIALTVAAIYHVLLLFLRRRLRSLAVIGCLFLLMTGVRFYLPVAIVAATAVWLLINGRGWSRLWQVPLVGGGGFVIAYRMIGQLGLSANGSAFFIFQQAGFGLAHIVLTPRPWGLTPDVSFLVVPAVVNWLFLPFWLAGGFLLCRRSPPARLVVIYAVFMLGLYAITPALQGYRQRYQLDFALCWMQWECLRWLWRLIRNRAAAGPGRNRGADEWTGCEALAR